MNPLYVLMICEIVKGGGTLCISPSKIEAMSQQKCEIVAAQVEQKTSVWTECVKSSESFSRHKFFQE